MEYTFCILNGHNFDKVNRPQSRHRTGGGAGRASARLRNWAVLIKLKHVKMRRPRVIELSTFFKERGGSTF